MNCKSCKFYVAVTHAYFGCPISKCVKMLTSGNRSDVVSNNINPYTSFCSGFQVDKEIFQGNLNQSGKRILLCHIAQQKLFEKHL